METGSNKKPEDFVNEPGPFDKITFEERYPPKKNKILNNVLESIGNTPLIRLNKVPQSFGVKCEILAKCEYFNPGGSIKDRIVMRMINDAEKHGRIKEGYHLAEPSSGNTGIGFGMVGAVRGYNITCTVPDKNEGEKLTLMKAQGIQLIKTASTVKFDDPESYFSIANRLSQELPNAATLNQYSNISNALANYDQTAEEILEACENKLDAIIIGTGTGGTITGIGNKIKERIPSCKVVGVDPVGSLIAQPDELNEKVQPYKVEGLGHDFVPNTCVRKVVDSWVKTRDKESLDLARRMIKEEGLLIGASCGSALYGAIRYALDNNLDEKQRIVVVMPDSVRNYMSKFLSDDWMITNEFLPMEIYKDSTHKLYGKTVKDLTLKEVKTYNKQMSIKEALDIFLSGEDEIILEKDGKIEGAIFEATFMTTLNEKRLNLSDTIQSINSKKVAIASQETDLSIVEKLLQNQQFILAKVINDSQQKLYRITSKDILKLSI